MDDTQSGDSHKLFKLESKQRTILSHLGRLAQRLGEVQKCRLNGASSNPISGGTFSIPLQLEAKKEFCEEKVKIKRNETRTLEKASGLLVKYFINLTDGIEVLHELPNLGIPRNEINFVRIMSSHCEANDYEGVLLGLDHNLMIHLALGTCNYHTG
mmetsp:Transcript_31373/g.43675  ORF Transcript_31373/g.43675 Transcript_31373/m.43675 type:complete len:156 (-) Transcript_31373:752-1219(-)